jgi:hypothetical protein
VSAEFQSRPFLYQFTSNDFEVLFGAYGAKTTAEMVQRHTREIKDLAVLPVRTDENEETLGVRLCVSGWLRTPNDITLPWMVFGRDDTFALQWVSP